MENKQPEQWEDIRKRLQQEFPDLTAEDLAYEIGKEEELAERLCKKTGKTKEEINYWLHMIG